MNNLLGTTRLGDSRFTTFESTIALNAQTSININVSEVFISALTSSSKNSIAIMLVETYMTYLVSNIQQSVYLELIELISSYITDGSISSYNSTGNERIHAGVSAKAINRAQLGVVEKILSVLASAHIDSARFIAATVTNITGTINTQEAELTEASGGTTDTYGTFNDYKARVAARPAVYLTVGEFGKINIQTIKIAPTKLNVNVAVAPMKEPVISVFARNKTFVEPITVEVNEHEHEH